VVTTGPIERPRVAGRLGYPAMAQLQLRPIAAIQEQAQTLLAHRGQGKGRRWQAIERPALP